MLGKLIRKFVMATPSVLVFGFVNRRNTLNPVRDIYTLIATFLVCVVKQGTGPRRHLRVLFVSLTLFVVKTMAGSLLFGALSMIVFLLYLMITHPVFSVTCFPVRLQMVSFISNVRGEGRCACVYGRR